MNTISPIRQNYFQKVDAINLFENRNQKGLGANIFESELFSQQQKGEYSLEHPRVAGSETQARHLDFLA